MKIILASHGSLAEGLLSAARTIIGEDSDIEAFGLDMYENTSAITGEVQKRIDAGDGEHTVILCDIKGGSVFNELLPLCAQKSVSLICGMNLNLVLELAMADSSGGVRDVQEDAIWVAKTFIEYYDADVLSALRQEECEDGLW